MDLPILVLVQTARTIQMYESFFVCERIALFVHMEHWLLALLALCKIFN